MDMLQGVVCPNRHSLKSKYFSFELVDELLKVKPHCIIAGFLTAMMQTSIITNNRKMESHIL
jgi:hypothetical protein